MRRRPRGDPRIGDGIWQAPVGCDGAGDHRFDLALVADVTVHPARLSALALYQGDRLLGSVVANVTDQDARTLAAQSERAGAPDATPATATMALRPESRSIGSSSGYDYPEPGSEASSLAWVAGSPHPNPRRTRTRSEPVTRDGYSGRVRPRNQKPPALSFHSDASVLRNLLCSEDPGMDSGDASDFQNGPPRMR